MIPIDFERRFAALHDWAPPDRSVERGNSLRYT
jgi:hypothetical protein